MNIEEYRNTLTGTAELKRVYIDTTGGLCPNNCFMCPARYKTKGSEPKMTDEVYKKIINDLAFIGYKEQLHFYTQCEPLVDNNLRKKIEYAREKLPDAHLKIISNFILLNEKKVEDLLKFPLDEVVNSIYALNHEDYKKICQTDHYKRAITNQIWFLKKFSKMEELPFQFRIYLIKMQENQHDDDFIEYFGNILPCNIINRTNFLRFPHDFVKKTYKPIPKGCCDFLYNTMLIYSNGDCTFCMCDPDANFGKMGNIVDMPIHKLINTEDNRKHRKTVFRGEDPMCKDRCHYCEFSIHHAELFWLPPSPFKDKLARELSIKKGNEGIIMDMNINTVDEVHTKSKYFNELFPDDKAQEWPDIINKLREDLKAGNLG